MDKVLSARVDEAVLQRLNLLVRRLDTTKKAVLERAILNLAKQVEAEQAMDIMDLTCGSWTRSETPQETVERSRAGFRRSMERHHE